MCVSISEIGDLDGVLPDECAVRVAKAGADIVGINCFYGPHRSVKILRMMKEGLEKAGIKKHLMIQPIGYLTPEVKGGFPWSPEFPLGISTTGKFKLNNSCIII
ncbi:S-methylmethionine--homocysteine S-methyltransferase BHMT2 [Exaiptasia diaphana]|uniref:Hcy-binding domain-containing protein n=1 Tax=Exaiptasia diaphana TaxID=2652724 RepID=A0A913XJC2_EXADI|nr:S-methylmethionine--homocysteine S-methyltransferase BHMT2 [Exaiptasia diaphana]